MLRSNWLNGFEKVALVNVTHHPLPTWILIRLPSHGPCAWMPSCGPRVWCLQSSTCFTSLTPASTQPSTSYFLRLWRQSVWKYAVSAAIQFVNGVTFIRSPQTLLLLFSDVSLDMCIMGKIFLFSLSRKTSLKTKQNKTKKSEKDKGLISLQTHFLISCLLYFHLKYLWTWGNVYFYDEYSLRVKIKGQYSNSVLFLRSTFFFEE